jgi:LysM repeat protein
VVAMVAAIHLIAFGGFSLMQGCAPRTVRTGSNSSRAIVNGGSSSGATTPAPAPTRTAATTPGGVTTFKPAASAATPAPAAPAARTTAVAANPALAGAVTMPPRSTTGRPANAAAPIPTGPAPTVQVKPFVPPATTYIKPPSTTPAPRRAPVSAPANAKPIAGSLTYKVQSGDSVSVIAARHGVKTREVLELNEITDVNKVRIGQQLLLPVHAKAPSGDTAAKPAADTTPAPFVKPTLVNAGGSGTYVVKNGDALSKIAKAHGTTTAELKKLNNLTSDSLRLNQVLKIPGAGSGSTAPETPATTFTAPSVDVGVKVPANLQPAPTPAITPPVLATNKNVAQTEIMALLGRDPKKPAPAPAAEAVEAVEADVPDSGPSDAAAGIGAKPIPYKVQPGDTVAKLAVIFLTSEAEIRRLNRMGPTQELRMGDNIEIPAPKDP